MTLRARRGAAGPPVVFQPPGVQLRTRSSSRHRGHTGAIHRAADTRRALGVSIESHRSPSRCTPGIRERGRGPALQARLGIIGRAADPGVVSGREVRHLHPLGRVLGAVLRAGAARQARLRRVVLERARRRQRPQAEPNPGGHVGRFSPAAVQRRTSITRTLLPSFARSCSTPITWADVFLRSGAKYIIPTSKHHEGFALWPSREASATWGRPWNAVDIDRRGTCSANCRRRCARRD